MKFLNILSCIIILDIIHLNKGSRILGIYVLPTRSHFIMINQLLKGLARKGHEVDVISMIPPSEEKIPNYKQVITLPNKRKSVFRTFSNNDLDVIKDFNKNPSKEVTTIGNSYCEEIFENSEFMKLIQNSPNDRPYDMIIAHLMTNQCLLILGHLWKIPVVLISTTSLYPWMHDIIGNPENIAFSSNNMIALTSYNSFRWRFLNFYFFYLYKFTYLYYSKDQDKTLRKYFGSNAPTVSELERNVSLILTNTYFPVNGARSMTTGVIEVGGLHIQNEESKLYDALQEWLDESTNGVIYLSFGSLFRIEKFPVEILNIIFKKFEKMSQIRVLIRIMKPEELPVEIPNNCKTLPWIPQQKVLQHPNVKMFITHGGTLGTQESIHYAVPMLCLPLFMDQWTNAYTYESKNIAITIDILSITQEKFDHAVDEILNNPIYRDNAQALSKLFRDRPRSPLDTGIFWVEFVLKHGKDSLRSAAMDLKWWQIALLDIYAAIILGIVLLFYILKCIFKIILKLIHLKKCNSVSKLKKHN